MGNKVGGEVAKKQRATVKVKSNLKFYAVQQKTDRSGIRLYKYDGSYWKTIKNTNGKATFPAVNLGSANMVLGWSKTQGKNALSSSDYKAGDRIPSKNGRYYMVVFGNIHGSQHRLRLQHRQNLTGFIVWEIPELFIHELL